jgi:hypothetical protein
MAWGFVIGIITLPYQWTKMFLQWLKGPKQKPGDEKCHTE